MSNNKLKNMIGNHELDDFVYDEKLKEKLCKLQTSEEVLELLKNYNYHESKEVFEVELMDLLKEFVGEEELLKVSGGKLNKQSFYNIITSLAVAGSLCMPVQGVTGVQQKEKREDKTSSYSIGLPPKEKSWLGVAVTTGIVGVGLAFVGVITNQKYTEMRKHFMNIVTSPEGCTVEDFKKYTVEDLKEYIFAELTKWFKSMDKHYKLENETSEWPKYVPDPGECENFALDWNKHLPRLICICHAIDSLRLVAGRADEKYLRNYLARISKNARRLDLLLAGQKDALKWCDGTFLVESNNSSDLESDRPIQRSNIMTRLQNAMECLMIDWTLIENSSESEKMDRYWVGRIQNELPNVWKIAKTDGFRRFLEELKGEER